MKIVSILFLLSTVAFSADRGNVKDCADDQCGVEKMPDGKPFDITTLRHYVQAPNGEFALGIHENGDVLMFDGDNNLLCSGLAKVWSLLAFDVCFTSNTFTITSLIDKVTYGFTPPHVVPYLLSDATFVVGSTQQPLVAAYIDGEIFLYTSKLHLLKKFAVDKLNNFDHMTFDNGALLVSFTCGKKLRLEIRENLVQDNDESLLAWINGDGTASFFDSEGFSVNKTLAKKIPKDLVGEIADARISDGELIIRMNHDEHKFTIVPKMKIAQNSDATLFAACNAEGVFSFFDKHGARLNKCLSTRFNCADTCIKNFTIINDRELRIVFADGKSQTYPINNGVELNYLVR